MIDPHACIAFSTVLFALGTCGVFVRRSLLTVLMSLELMFAASVIALVSFDQMRALADGGSGGVAGQGFAVLILSVVTAQMMVGVGLLVAARRNRGPGGDERPGSLGW
jgi:NADH-quinone oxidoreductase subunit K